MHEKNAAVLVSGGGSNLQAILDAKARGEMPHTRVRLVIASRAGAYALERAQNAGVECRLIEAAAYETGGGFDKAAYSAAVLDAFRVCKIDAAALAGFLVILTEPLLSAYRGRILNVHPSLIPAFCGEGFHGLAVHEAALARGVKVSGATVHLVNGVIDGGAIVAQKAVAVKAGDTPERLQRRVMQQAEWVLLPRALEALCAALPIRPAPGLCTGT